MPVPVVLFADFTCPFSYVTEAMLLRLAAEGLAAPEPRAFELFPAPQPLPPHGPAADVEAARAVAGEAGVSLRMVPPPARTRKAHEAARFAQAHGLGPEMRAALYRAAFEEGRDLGRIDVLCQVAADVGLDPTSARIALDIDRHAGAVAHDLAEAARLCLAGTPAMVVGAGAGARLLTGAFPLDELRAALRDPG